MAFSWRLMTHSDFADDWSMTRSQHSRRYVEVDEDA